MDSRNEKYEEKAELARVFEEKHSAFLTKLAGMPVGWGQGDNRERRLQFFRLYPMQADFYMEAMEAYKPKEYRRFMERESRRRQAIDEARRDKFDMEQDGDIASKKHREDIDNVAYAEALSEAVCGYTGMKTDGTPYNFIACLGQFYRQIAGRMATRYDLSEAGISDAGISDKNLCKVVRLVCKTKELARREGHEESPEKIMEMILEVLPRDYTEKEREFIQNFVFDAGYPLSFDAAAGEEDEAGAAP